MPIVQKFSTEAALDFNEFLEIAKGSVDVNTLDGLLALAEPFAMLGNNRDFLAEFFRNFILRKAYEDPFSVLLSQSVVLARFESFYVRANFWLPDSDMTQAESILFAYDQPHDHNFNLLSLAYCGDGYISDGFEYNYDSVVGYVGENVALTPLGAHKHECGDVLLYVCNKDIHVQHPPSTASITLNVIPLGNQNGLKDQYFFEIPSASSELGVIKRHAPNIIEQRRHLFEIAKHIADDEIANLFADIARNYICGRTRYEALRALKHYDVFAHDQLAYSLRDDPVPIIRKYVHRILDEHASA